MNRLLRPLSLAWLALIVGATLFVAGSSARRIGEIERVSQLATGAATDDTSPTGYVRGMRNLILPETTPSGQPWIMDVQRMMANGAEPVKDADYDNAPEGRPIQAGAPYRTWLRLIAGLEGMLGIHPAGRAVERAALHANPVLHGLLCLGAGLFAAWRFGAASGGLLALSIAVLFPLSPMFAPGQPDDHGLFLSVNLATVLLLLAGSHAAGRGATRLCLAFAGAATGFGLCLDPGSQLTVLTAVWIGGLLTVGFTARPVAAATPTDLLPWRWWAAGGAITALAGWLVEGRPGGISGVDLDHNHPLIVIAWLAGAEVLVRLPSWRLGGARRLDFIVLAGAAAMMIFVPGWLLHQGGRPTSFGPDISGLAAYTAQTSLTGWIFAEGLSLAWLATVLPLLLGVIALWQARQNPALRRTLVLAMGAAGVLLALGVVQLRWWSLLDTTLLGLLAVVTASLGRAGWRSAMVLLLVPGFVLTWPKIQAGEELSPSQARALIERDLAQWLSARSEPGTIAFAPPALSASLCYYGGLKIIASPYPGNTDGLALALRISSITSTDEAQAFVQRRGIHYIILPSWDTTLDEFARLGGDAPERSLVSLLRQWLPPRWLRAVPYQQPVIPGFEGDSFAVFEVVELQEDVMALSWLAEYFLETNRLELADKVGAALQLTYGSNPSAMIARAQVAVARGHQAQLQAIMKQLLPAVADGQDEDLPWERRANLAVVLAQTRHNEQAAAQIAFCLKESDVERLRSLSTVTLYRLLTLARAYRMEFPEPALREAALQLLPEEFRHRLQR